MLNHVMVDIETLGGAPDGALIQIGACAFDFNGGVGEKFCVNVSLRDATTRGMKIDASTVEFWMGQPEAWASLQSDKKELGKALEMLRLEYGWGDLAGVWTNAPLFDFAILRHAYKLIGSKTPWSHRQERCSRTLFWMAAQRGNIVIPDRTGTRHNAGDDAINQAAFAIHLYRIATGDGIEGEK